MCWQQPPPFHLLHESINVQIKLFIKVARGAGGSAYCDQQWGRVSLDVKSSNCQITKLRQNAFEKSTQKLPLKLGCTIGPSRLYSLKYRTRGMFRASLGPGNGSTGPQKLTAPQNSPGGRMRGCLKCPTIDATKLYTSSTVYKAD